MNYANPSIALGLLLMGMGIGAFLSREFFRRNLEAVLQQEIEKRYRCGLSIDSGVTANDSADGVLRCAASQRTFAQAGELPRTSPTGRSDHAAIDWVHARTGVHL